MSNIKNTLSLENVGTIYRNLDLDTLIDHAVENEGAKISSTGALMIDTGIFTGRSPADKYFVNADPSNKYIAWGDVNKPITKEIYTSLLDNSKKQLSGKDLYVTDLYCGASADSRKSVRFITEIAWQAHFVKNMFIVPPKEDLEDFIPEFTVYNSCKTTNENFESQGLNSEVYVAFDVEENEAVIGGTWYAGEMKKGIFSMMNYWLPLDGKMAMHCSANVGEDGDTALFFGLSGTGKTTLSTDPKRALIGDDEHGWSDDGVFNFEGGCYAKVINLNPEAEPQIYAVTQMFGTILENVVFGGRFRHLDLDDDMYTENTRASYPLEFISNAVPGARGGNPKNIFMLTCDVSGVLPPISRLSADQAMYHFISGYTSKVGGTEIGLGADPISTFSACFGAPFMVHHPYVYAQLLKDRMLTHNVNCWLINTGWTGGPFGVGSRISIQYTRALLNAALDGGLDAVKFRRDPVFGFEIPESCPDVPSEILDPISTWADKEDYQRRYQNLAVKFVENFKQFEDGVTAEVIAAGPKV